MNIPKAESIYEGACKGRDERLKYSIFLELSYICQGSSGKGLPVYLMIVAESCSVMYDCV